MTIRHALFGLVSLVLVTSVLAAGPESRLVKTKPVEGLFVETDQGYMVPYEQAIPGSNAVIEMVPIPAGTILLRPLPQVEANDDSPSTEASMKRVKLDPFWIGKYEITMEQFMPYRRLYYQQRKFAANNPGLVIDANAVDAVTGPTEVYDKSISFEFAEKPNSPVTSASQFATRQFSKYLSLLAGVEYRLPRRSEWQHACRGEGRTRYCFGDDSSKLEEYAVFGKGNDDSVGPLVVGQKRPSDWGLFDMHGNVHEFVIEDTAVYGLRFGHVACGGSATSEAARCAYDSIVRTDIEWWDNDPDTPLSCWWMTSQDANVTGFRILAPLGPMTTQEKRAYWNADSKELVEDLRYRVTEGRGSLGRVKPYESTTRVVD